MQKVKLSLTHTHTRMHAYTYAITPSTDAHTNTHFHKKASTLTLYPHWICITKLRPRQLCVLHWINVYHHQRLSTLTLYPHWLYYMHHQRLSTQTLQPGYMHHTVGACVGHASYRRCHNSDSSLAKYCGSHSTVLSGNLQQNRSSIHTRLHVRIKRIDTRRHFLLTLWF